MRHAKTTEESTLNTCDANLRSSSSRLTVCRILAIVILAIFTIVSCLFLLNAYALPYEDLSLLGSSYKDITAYTSDRSPFLLYWSIPLLGLFGLCMATALPARLHQTQGVVFFALLVASIDGCAAFKLFTPPQAQSGYLTRTAIGSIESIRAALHAYAADSARQSFPAAIATWEELTKIVNPNGANLQPTAAEQGFHLRAYTAIDSDNNGVFEDYAMSFLVDGVSDAHQGRLVLVSPERIEKGKL